MGGAERDELAVARRLLASLLPSLCARFASKLSDMAPATLFDTMTDLLRFDVWTLDTYKFGSLGFGALLLGERTG